MPGVDDVLKNLHNIPRQTSDKFIPQNSETLARMWVNLVEISHALGKILRIHYRVNDPNPTVGDVNNCAEELRHCKPAQRLHEDSDDLLRLHAFHVDLFYEYEPSAILI
jgi:hypothetical protein